ncbi:hypothetical protein V5O48_013108 [Marasmius crinis-equi]|uniref:Cytochrome P450 n=1 Tax=Marasmius crinis-equi TaxID=585013 RepID=A0ABR3F0Z8_9AGAR
MIDTPIMTFVTHYRGQLEAIRSSLSLSQLGIGALVFYLAYRYVAARRARSELDRIPTVGHDGIIMSYLTAWRTFTDCFNLIDEGCRKYPGGAFKIPTFTGWRVIVNGPNLINDLRRATDEEMSMDQAIFEDLQTQYTISPAVFKNPYHVDVVRTPLTRNIINHLDDMLDETRAAFADNIPLQDDWVELPVVSRIQNMVVRISNRVFVGLPLCRDPDWCDLNIQFTINVAVNSILISLFPKILQPIVGRIFTTRNRSMRRTMKHLAPIIKQRLETGERPNDMISWTIDTGNKVGEEWQKGSAEDICVRILTNNFGAIHTSSVVFTNALYHLAANPELVEPLRREVETAVEKDGWTKSAVLQLRLVDSFLKESQRRAGFTTQSLVSMPRIALKDIKFSDGTVIPAGTKIGAASHYTHTHEEIYPTPNEFVPFRFADGTGSAKRPEQMVTLHLDWLLFGGGKHACPGRFFAVTELKIMFAHLILNYDVKFKRDDMGFPPSVQFGYTKSPNPDVKVMFRKRERRDEME